MLLNFSVNIYLGVILDFFVALVVKNHLAMQVLSLGQEDPLEEGMATHSSTLA